MKSKHYPVVTTVAGGLLIAVPLLSLWLFLSSSSETPSKVEQVAESPKNTHSYSSRPTGANAVSPVKPSPAQSTRVASNAAVALTPVPESQLSRVLKSTEPSVSRFEHVSTSPNFASPGITSAADTVPVPIEPDMTPVPMIAPALIHPNVDASSEPSNSDIIEVPSKPVVSESYYQATGHLAMANQPEIETAVPDLVAKDATSSDSEENKSATSTNSKGRARSTKPGSRKENKDTVAVRTDVTGVTSDIVRSVDTGAADASLVEEIVIQTPVETAPVARVENLVAMTRAKGWPIALVRSDLPDDVWWVQQAVGIQGTSFAARVNFGNEFSLTGSAYRMVIVFLDSPDEVRRFRIAKQFKEIPEGVRRSREFRYVRN